MGLWRSIAGQVTVMLTSADLPKSLEVLTSQNIQLHHVSYVDSLSVSFAINYADINRTAKICEKRGDSLTVQNETGLLWFAKYLINRPILVFGFLLLLIATVVIPKHVYFFYVEGNEQVADRRILDAARECGIYFGASRKEVRSEKVKNALLEAIPELQWAGINTRGCTATISVRERKDSEETPSVYRVTKIISFCDAVITSCTVEKGNPVCKVGQIVQKGDTLISGYTDCGLSVLAAKASGEVLGLTNHAVELILPLEQKLRTEKTESHSKFSIIIGKKRINLWDTRGLSYGSCGKITKICPVRLFGGFELPISFEIETYEQFDEELFMNKSKETLENAAADYVISHMISGKIIESSFQISEHKDKRILSGEFFCEEMIGREQNEELIENEQNH